MPEARSGITPPGVAGPRIQPEAELKRSRQRPWFVPVSLTLSAPAALAPQPLSGLRVVDVGNFLAGPYAATVMGEFGAEVIKVEHPDGGDPMRRFGTAPERPDATPKWLSESRNKRSVTMDLLQPEGVALFLKLIAKSDVLADPQEGGGERSFAQQDLWHYTFARMVDACAASGIRAFYGPFGDLKDEAGCEAQFRNAFIMGCTGAWSLAPNQIAIAKRVFSPDVKEVLFAKRILDAMPDGTGVATIDGKMQDDATWKQAKVMVDLARLVARKDPALAAAYGFEAEAA